MPAQAALASAACVYFAFVLIAYFILRRVAVSDFVDIGIFGRVLVAFLTAGFLMALAYDVFPVRAVYAFTPALDHLFAAKQYFFWWFTGPLLGLFYLAVSRF